MNTKTKNYLLLASSCVVIIAVGIMLFTASKKVAPTLLYQSAEYAIAFRYPENYVLEERDSAGRHTIVLTEETALAAVAEGAEGPTSITIDTIENPKALSPSAWVKADPISNYHISPDGTLASSTFAGAEAVAYVWDGLYRGESYVFDHGDRLVMVSVTMHEPSDKIREDFTRILRSLVLQ